jgi:hypothetical protein
MLFALPAPVKADGGPVVDPLLFAKLKEGQQVAVVRLIDAKTASIDLFVSILDQTGESHEITYFVPLGTEASHLNVYEESSYDFNSSLTSSLDMALFQDFRQGQQVAQMLFAGALLTNGIWLTPLWASLFLTGCAGSGPAPISSFKTDSSEVSVFAIDQTTDIAALVSSTGLDPSVTETLKRISGQQIAVVKLHTQPQAATPEGTANSAGSQGDPGLHLSWMTSLIQGESGATYSYPLGTGASWAHPIEITRVYVVAPADLGFSVSYPKLGADRSGFAKDQHGLYEPGIVGAGLEPAYAVDGAIYESNPNGMRVWRVSYANSNASEDIIIKVSPNLGKSLAVNLHLGGVGWALGVGIFFAALFWILAWLFLMPRLLGRGSRIGGLWKSSLFYLGLNALLFIPGAIPLVIFSFGSTGAALAIAVFLFAGASIVVFQKRHLDKLGVSKFAAIRAFIIVTLASNGAYLLFVFAYSRLTSAT